MFEKVISKWTGNQTKEHILHTAEVGTERAQWLRAFVALVDNLGSIPNTHMVAENHL